MSTAPILEAPKGWDAYAAGRHIDMSPPDLSSDHAANTATVAVFVDRLANENGSDLLAWLQLYDTVPEKVAYMALGERLPEALPNAAPDWRTVERAALAPRQGAGSKWLARCEALGKLAANAPGPASPEAAAMTWLERVTLGRLHQHLGDCTLREFGAASYLTVEGHLRDADAWFSDVQGGQDLRAMVDIVRGRAQAWRNGARGATAVLSIALARFREQHNQLREAEAAYELGIANLDSNYPEAADKLFSVSVEANRQRKQQPEALARALQSRGRARLEHAQQTPPGKVRDEILAAAEKDAREAFDLSEPSPLARQIEGELSQLGNPEGSNLGGGAHDSFRAAMAARDLAAIELVWFNSTPDQTSGALQRARQWFRIACKQQGFGHIFDEGGRGGLRQELDTAATGEQFTLLRLLQLELDILRRGARNDSLEILVEVAKRFLARNEINYAIECLKSAADGYQARSEDPGDDDRAAADYWRYRAARLASMIGARFSESNLPAAKSPELQKAFGETAQRLEATVLQLVSEGTDSLTAEVVTAGRHAACILHVFSPNAGKSIDFARLQRLSDRGDCPRIVEWRADQGQWGYVLAEQVNGQPLRDMLQLGRTPDSAEIELRIRIAARLCRAMAALLFAHTPHARLAQPLFVTPDDICVLPGGRCVIARYGQMHGLSQPSIGWSYLYDGLTNDGVWPMRADAVATARIVCLLLGVTDPNAGNLRVSTYVRRVFLRKTRALEMVSQKAVEALDRLLRSKRPTGEKTEDERKEDARATPKQGYADLMRLADHLDRSVGMLKSGKTPT